MPWNPAPSNGPSIPKPTRFPGAFWILFALAGGVRVGLIAVSQNVDHGEIVHPGDYGDTHNYLDYGVIFADGLEPRDQIPTNRDRLLPFSLGLIFRFTGRSVLAAQLLCAGFAQVGLILLYLLGRQLLAHKAALLACTLWTFDPSTLGQSCLPLTESVATPLLIGSLYLLVVARRHDSWSRLLASSVVLVLAFHARASTLSVGVAAAVWLLTWPQPWTRRLLRTAAYTGVLVAGWFSSCLISYELFGVFVPNTHAYSLWGHAAAKMMIQHGLAKNMHEGKDLREAEARGRVPPDASLAEFLEAKKQLDLAYIRRYPVLQLRNSLTALLATAVLPDRWSLPAMFGVHRSGGIWQRPVSAFEKAQLALRQWGPIVTVHVALHSVWTLVLWCGTLAAVPALLNRNRRAPVALLLLTVAAVLASGAINVEAEARYRLPAIPMMALLAASWPQRRTA